MNNTKFLTLALFLIAIPVIVIFLLPTGIAPIYTSVVQSLYLFIGAVIAFRISFHYRMQLKSAFAFLSAFLFIYMLSIVLFTYAKSFLEDYHSLTVLLFQIANYSMIILFCYCVLKVVDIRRLDKVGWVVFAATLSICIIIAIFPVVDLINDVLNGKLPPVPNSLIQSVSYIIIRLFDAALVTALMPVVWLYVQYLKSQHEQSLTFTVIVSGIICATLFDYLFQSTLQIFPQLLAPQSYLHKNIPEALYLYGYSTIAVGLYAHLKRDVWGYDIVDKAMSGKVDLVGGK